MKHKRLFACVMLAAMLFSSTAYATEYPWYEYGKTTAGAYLPIPENGIKTPKKRKKVDMDVVAPSIAEYTILYKSPVSYKTGHRMVDDSNVVVSETSITIGTTDGMSERINYFGGKGKRDQLYAMSVKNHAANPGGPVKVFGRWKP